METNAKQEVAVSDGKTKAFIACLCNHYRS